jgi:hypothetical protein
MSLITKLLGINTSQLYAIPFIFGIGVAGLVWFKTYIHTFETVIATQKETLVELSAKLNDKQTELTVCELNKHICENSLLKQNEERLIIQNELSKKRLELESWKNRPKEDKYKIIYKYIKEDNNESCENFINDISNVNLNLL